MMRPVIDFLNGRIESHAVPRAVHMVEALPKTSAGKILRSALREAERPKQ